MPVAKMHSLIPEKVGLSLGLLFALVYFVGIVILQWGGAGILNWAETLHFISTDATYTILPFDLATVILGFVAHFITGAIIGAAFAWIWNWAIKLK